MINKSNKKINKLKVTDLANKQTTTQVREARTKTKQQSVTTNAQIQNTSKSKGRTKMKILKVRQYE